MKHKAISIITITSKDEPFQKKDTKKTIINSKKAAMMTPKRKSIASPGILIKRFMRWKQEKGDDDSRGRLGQREIKKML